MKCTKCGGDSINNSRICSYCLGKWTDMRSTVFNELEKKYGILTQVNHEIYKKEMKRLENIWRKDKDKFTVELEKINQ